MEHEEVRLPGYVARSHARSIIWLTALLIAALWSLLFIAAPGGSSPMFSGPTPDPLALLMVPVGMQLFGLGWMVRIDRAARDVEPDHGNWRYRAR